MENRVGVDPKSKLIISNFIENTKLEYGEYSTSTSKMYEYKYEYIFLQCTQVRVRVLWKVLEYKYEYIFNFIM